MTKLSVNTSNIYLSNI